MINKYTYFGFNSLGRNIYQTGSFDSDKLVFIGEIKKEDKIVTNRTTLIPSKDGTSFEFIVEIDDNGKWVQTVKEIMIKIK